MPKTIHGQPVDESKWEKAKAQAEKEGHGGDYAYIMGIYKRMAGMSKSRLVIFRDMAELIKGAPLPIGTRKIHGFGTPKAQWVKKGADGKWHYDGMVTPADVKKWEADKMARKRLGKMKTNMEKKKAEAEAKKGSQAADNDRPDDATLDKSPKKVQMYWRDVSDRARDLCDLTGVLCMNKEAEDYVTKNLSNVFKMTKEQETEFKKIMPDIPMGSDGKWLDDPLFLEEVRAAMEGFKKEIGTKGYKQRVEAALRASRSGMSQGEIDTYVETQMANSLTAVDTWIRLIDTHENDKRVLDRVSELDAQLRGVQNMDGLIGALLGVVAPSEEINIGNYNDYHEINQESKDFLASIGIDEEMYDSHRYLDEDAYYHILLGLICPKFGEAIVKPWMDVMGTRYRHSYYSGARKPTKPMKWDDIEKKGAAIREKYAAIAKFFDEFVTIDTTAFNERMGQVSSGSGDGITLNHFINNNTVYAGGATIQLNPEATWRDIGNTLKSMMRAKTFAWDKTVSWRGYVKGSHTVVPMGNRFFESIINAGRVLGNTRIDQYETEVAIHDKLSVHFNSMSEELRACFGGTEAMAQNASTGSVSKANARKQKRGSSSIYTTPQHVSVSDDETGIVMYREGKKASMSGGYRNRYRSGRSGYGGWMRGDLTRAIIGKTEESLKRNVLRGKFYKTVASISGYHRYTPEICHTHAGASLMYAVGANWNVRSLAKKSKVVPDWSWGHLKPYSTGNRVGDPLPNGGSVSMMSEDGYRDQIKQIRNEQLASSLGMKAKGTRTMPVITLKGLGESGRNEWLKKLKDDWTHGHGYSANYGADRVKVNAVFDVMYHDYYDAYKAIEKDKDNQQYMYHGTDFQAGSSIIKGGFKIMSNQKAGRLLGDGIYLAKSSSKSAQYLASRSFSNNSGESGVMLACRASLGKVSPGQSAGEKYEGQWDTVYAAKGMPYGGRVMQHDEWCIRNPKGLVPIQWIDVSI